MAFAREGWLGAQSNQSVAELRHFSTAYRLRSRRFYANWRYLGSGTLGIVGRGQRRQPRFDGGPGLGQVRAAGVHLPHRA